MVMEQPTTGKQGKDDNNIGSIITMLITDQVLTIIILHISPKREKLSDKISQRCIFALESEKVQSLFGGIQNFKLA